MNLHQIIKIIRDNPDLKQFSRQSLAVLCMRLVGALLAFLVQIPLTRLLGAEQYGVYVYVLSWVLVLAVFARLGMGTALIKYIASYTAQQSWKPFKGLLVFVFLSVLCIILILIICLFILRPFLVAQGETIFTSYTGAASLLLILISLSGLFQAALRGLKNFTLQEFMDGIARPFCMLGLFLLFFNMWGGMAKSILTAHILTLVVIIAVIAPYFLAKIPSGARKAKADLSPWKIWAALAASQFFMEGMDILLNRTDIIMLGVMAGPAEAGIYAVATRMADLPRFGLEAVNAVIAPIIAELYQGGQREKLQQILSFSAWAIFAFTMVAGIIFIFIGPLLLQWFGDDFVAGYYPLLVLVGGKMIVALIGTVGFLMTMTGHHNFVAITYFAAVVLNIIGNFLLIPIYGQIGAAFTTSFCMVLWSVCLLIYVWKKLNLNPSILPLGKTLHQAK